MPLCLNHKTITPITIQAISIGAINNYYLAEILHPEGRLNNSIRPKAVNIKTKLTAMTPYINLAYIFNKVLH